MFADGSPLLFPLRTVTRTPPANAGVGTFDLFTEWGFCFSTCNAEPRCLAIQAVWDGTTEVCTIHQELPAGTSPNDMNGVPLGTGWTPGNTIPHAGDYKCYVRIFSPSLPPPPPESPPPETPPPSPPPPSPPPSSPPNPPPSPPPTPPPSPPPPSPPPPSPPPPSPPAPPSVPPEPPLAAGQSYGDYQATVLEGFEIGLSEVITTDLLEERAQDTIKLRLVQIANFTGTNLWQLNGTAYVKSQPTFFNVRRQLQEALQEQRRARRRLLVGDALNISGCNDSLTQIIFSVTWSGPSFAERLAFSAKIGQLDFGSLPNLPNFTGYGSTGVTCGAATLTELTRDILGASPPPPAPESPVTPVFVALIVAGVVLVCLCCCCCWWFLLAVPEVYDCEVRISSRPTHCRLIVLISTLCVQDWSDDETDTYAERLRNPLHDPHDLLWRQDCRRRRERYSHFWFMPWTKHWRGKPKSAKGWITQPTRLLKERVESGGSSSTEPRRATKDQTQRLVTARREKRGGWITKPTAVVTFKQ